MLSYARQSDGAQLIREAGMRSVGYWEDDEAKETSQEYRDDEDNGEDHGESFRSMLVTDGILQQIQRQLCLIKLSWPASILENLDNASVPTSYTSNSDKEKLLLWYAENLRKQYNVVYKDRKPLLLTRDNEYGIQKFVSTTIRPSTLAYPELYDWQGCAKFISDHLEYESLKNPILMPDCLRSPTNVLFKQRGNSFEMSTVLVSILLGKNYNAYVVSGYASREQVHCDYSRRTCPHLPNENAIPEPSSQVNVSRYRMKPPPDTTSRFLADMEARERAKADEDSRRREEEQRKLIAELERPTPDKLWGKRIHAWVVILPEEYGDTGHMIDRAIFIEPSSGDHYDPKDTKTNELYSGVESIWNDKNYWVNVQSCEDGCSSINWDLTKPKLWEHLLPGEPWTTRGVAEDELDGDLSIQIDKHLDMPFSWVQRIEISSTKYEERYPNGKKTVLYKKTKLELFAPYLEPNGLVQRITLYTDYEYSSPVTVYETYSTRTDNLVLIHKNLDTKSAIEYYKRGRPDACKEHRYSSTDTTAIGERILDFYDVVRVDGLTRLEICPTYLKQYFVNRADRLCYRCVEYATERTELEENRREVRTIIEKYLRNDAAPASKDIAIREFAIWDNEIRLKYHYEESRVTRATRTFTKPLPSDMGERLTFDPAMTHGYNPDPMASPEKSLDLFYELDRQLKAEAGSILLVSQARDQVKIFLEEHEHNSLLPTLSISLFDRNRNEDAKAKMLAKEEILKARSKREVIKDVDYLGPYLVRVANPTKLTRTLAHRVQQDCLRDFRQQLVDRANAMLQKFEKDSKVLKQKQATLIQVHNSREDKEKLQAEIDTLIFDLHTLEHRLDRHRELVPQSYRTLVDNLKADPRLAVLHDSVIT